MRGDGSDVPDESVWVLSMMRLLLDESVCTYDSTVYDDVLVKDELISFVKKDRVSTVDSCDTCSSVSLLYVFPTGVNSMFDDITPRSIESNVQ